MQFEAGALTSFHFWWGPCQPALITGHLTVSCCRRAEPFWIYDRPLNESGGCTKPCAPYPDAPGPHNRVWSCERLGCTTSSGVVVIPGCHQGVPGESGGDTRGPNQTCCWFLSSKWNRAVVGVLEPTRIFPAMKSQNACCASPLPRGQRKWVYFVSVVSVATA